MKVKDMYHPTDIVERVIQERHYELHLKRLESITGARTTRVKKKNQEEKDFLNEYSKIHYNNHRFLEEQRENGIKQRNLAIFSKLVSISSRPLNTKTNNTSRTIQHSSALDIAGTSPTPEPPAKSLNARIRREEQSKIVHENQLLVDKMLHQKPRIMHEEIEARHSKHTQFVQGQMKHRDAEENYVKKRMSSSVLAARNLSKGKKLGKLEDGGVGAPKPWSLFENINESRTELKFPGSQSKQSVKDTKKEVKDTSKTELKPAETATAVAAKVEETPIKEEDFEATAELKAE